jgi:hypothetical protein
MTFAPLAFLVLAAVPVFADPLGDVRAALGRLPAREPVRATLELQQSVVSEGKFDNDKFAGKVAVELEGNSSGFHIIVPRPLLEQLDRERNAQVRDPKQKTATVSALNEIVPAATVDAIDFAPTLLRLLDGGKLVSDAAGTWQGKPARVLVVRVSDRSDPEEKGRLKVSDNKLTLWLGSDLVPLAAEHIFNAKVSILVFKAEFKRKESWHLARSGDRLIRARYESTQVSSGMGQKGNESVVATVRVH